MRMALTGGSSTHSRLGEGTVVCSALGESWGLGRSSLSGLVSLGSAMATGLILWGGLPSLWKRKSDHLFSPTLSTP